MTNRRIGLVGCGRWGSHILRDLIRLECDVTVLAVSEDSLYRAREGGASSIVREYDQLAGLSGLVVATPTSAHYSTINRVLDFDIPIFCEKPLTCNAGEARDLATRAGGRLFVMDKWRYHPGVEELGRIAREGTLGRVLGLRTTRIGWGNPHTDVDAVWILIPHDLSIALEILGEIPDPISAVAAQMNGQASGMVALLGKNVPVVIEVSARRAGARREVVLECEHGVASLDDSCRDRIRLSRRSEANPEAAPMIEERRISTELPLLRELRAFVGFLSGDDPPRSSADEGARTVEVISQLRNLAGLPA